MKKVIKICLTLLITVSMLSISSVNAKNYGDFEYNVLSNNTVEITGYYGEDTKVIIPSNIDGKKVTAIGGWAFYDRAITSIEIPNTVTTIEKEAFYCCENLKTVKFQANSQLKTIGEDAFYETAITSIEIPNTVTNIGNDAFSHCENLKTVKFQANSQLKTIGYCVFYDTAITSIEIPNTVTNIRSSAFVDCENLKTVKFQANSQLKTIGDYAFAWSGITSIDIPDSVTTIEEETFYKCPKLKSVIIGNKVKTIEKKAFFNTALTSITIPKNVTSLEYKSMDNCKNLSKITLPTTLNKIGGRSFNDTKWYNNKPNGSVYINKVYYQYKGNMPKNTTVNIKKGTVRITDFAFDECKNLKSVNIPDSVKYIGEGAFANCPSMKSVAIPSSVTSIDGIAFGFYKYDPFYDDEDNYYSGNNFVGYYKKVPGFTIYGDVGSAAEKYAKKHGFKFVKRTSISKAKVTTKNKVAYTGKHIKPSVTVKNGKTTLKKNIDYTVSYNNNKKTGKATITITGIGKYKGTKKVSFYIVPKAPTGLKLTTGKKNIKVSYKKSTGASGYQIAYSTSKSKGFKYITVNSKTASKVIKKLKSKKKYYVKVRAYKTVGKKRYYGSYTKLKSIKVK